MTMRHEFSKEALAANIRHLVEKEGKPLDEAVDIASKIMRDAGAAIEPENMVEGEQDAED